MTFLPAARGPDVRSTRGRDEVEEKAFSLKLPTVPTALCLLKAWTPPRAIRSRLFPDFWPRPRGHLGVGGRGCYTRVFARPARGLPSPYGGCSSRAERRTVAPDVGGSNPLTHPNTSPSSHFSGPRTPEQRCGRCLG